jgi:bacterioferritin (cytochrome b1)
MGTGIASKKELVERLKELLIVEVKARESYKEDLVTYTNFQLLDRFRRIEQDEEKHIRILGELIALLSREP